MKIYEINNLLELSKTPYVTFRFRNGKVMMSGRGKSSDAFRRVYYYDRDYMPNDGASYLNAVVASFRMSSRLAVILEDIDTWYDSKYGALAEIIKTQTIK
jgi:hypothetical protein